MSVAGSGGDGGGGIFSVLGVWPEYGSPNGG